MEAKLDNGDKTEQLFDTVSAQDCPEIFPYFVEQFHRMRERFPSIYVGSLESDLLNFGNEELCDDNGSQGTLLAMVDWQTLTVVSGISFIIIPKTATIYIDYMLTLPHFRSQGLMKTLFEAMKEFAHSQFPVQFRRGVNAILCETLAIPKPEYEDYFSNWKNICKTHAALNKIGFYQCCFNSLMYGDRNDDGFMDTASDEYIMLVHKDSRGISPSEHPNFNLNFDCGYIVSMLQAFVRCDMEVSEDVPPNLGSEFLAVLSSIPREKCPLRRALPFYRTDKMYPDNYGGVEVVNMSYFHDNVGSHLSEAVAPRSRTSSWNEIKEQSRERLKTSKELADILTSKNHLINSESLQVPRELSRNFYMRSARTQLDSTSSDVSLEQPISAVGSPVTSAMVSESKGPDVEA